MVATTDWKTAVIRSGFVGIERVQYRYEEGDIVTVLVDKTKTSMKKAAFLNRYLPDPADDDGQNHKPDPHCYRCLWYRDYCEPEGIAPGFWCDHFVNEAEFSELYSQLYKYMSNPKMYPFFRGFADTMFETVLLPATDTFGGFGHAAKYRAPYFVEKYKVEWLEGHLVETKGAQAIIETDQGKLSVPIWYLLMDKKSKK